MRLEDLVHGFEWLSYLLGAGLRHVRLLHLLLGARLLVVVLVDVVHLQCSAAGINLNSGLFGDRLMIVGRIWSRLVKSIGLSRHL